MNAPHVLDLASARDARAAEVERHEALRPLLVRVVLTSFAVLPSGADLDMDPTSEVLDAADLASDPGRLGEMARAMLARVEAAKADISKSNRSADRAG